MVEVSAKMLNAEMVIMGIWKTVDLKCKEWIVKVSEKNCAHWTNGRFDQTKKKGVEVYNERKEDGHKNWSCDYKRWVFNQQ